MKLNDYLKELRACPPDELPEKCGVYDNFPIFVRVDFEKLISDLTHSRKFHFLETVEEKFYMFRHSSGNPVFHAYNHVKYGLTGIGDKIEDLTEQERLHRERQIRDYNASMVLHPNGELPKMVKTIEDIARFIKRRRIPACFPYTEEWKSSQAQDFSRIVYYPDE